MRADVGHEKSFNNNLNSSLLASRRQPTTINNNTSLRGIRINISSDPFQHRIPPYIQRLWQESKIRKRLSAWKRRLIKRYRQTGWIELSIIIFGLFFGCIFLLVHVGFFSGKKYQDWQQEHSEDNQFMEEVDLLDKVYPDEGRLQTTAILLSLSEQNSNLQQKKSKLQPILKQLCQYDMFANYIVWNDDPIFNMTLDMIYTEGCTPSKLTIINAPVKMGVSARYHACRLSKTPYCYFQDVFIEEQQLRSIYANFLRSPHLIHGKSSNYQAFINSQWRYCFLNKDVQLHTCYIDIKSGAFAAKAMVSQFLETYDQNSVVDDFADIYFMMYMNQIPYQLEGNDDSIIVKELTKKEIEHMDLGLTILYNDLEEGIIPIKPYLESKFERNARAPCRNDRCLFLTNKQIMPAIDLFSYNPTIYINTLQEMHDDYYTSTTNQHQYSNAVDGNEDSSWKSIQNIQAGDYIGLDMLMPMRTSLMYRFLVNQPYVYRTRLNVQISYDGLLWLKLHPLPSFNCQNIDNDRQQQLLECQFIVTDTGYRYIRLESQKDHDFPFDVYDLSFSAKVKKDANGQLLEMTLNDESIAFVEDEFTD
ncbi:uncharacterized protein BX663DRAFT_552209 [Cokeromyces recurvatus]|uniref:uncharacterized protein n=1 Tax=Cokeromyces recurvatus TaxID=90255 RepID=UPI0022203F0D|nr:uncharacterized protein BX663DRAFT_552209 [Cokeromyces recurvatus]KAI7902816.1 hypothetical protein BX663DRAFT_552209 [Cokeromyces recurvatus]